MCAICTWNKKNLDNQRKYFEEDRNNQRSGPVREDRSDQLCSEVSKHTKVCCKYKQTDLFSAMTVHRTGTSGLKLQQRRSNLGIREGFFPMVKITLGMFAEG